MKCRVLFPHVRHIGEQLVMYEPMIAPVVDVPDDDQTRGAIEANWLEPLEAAKAEGKGVRP